MVRNRRKDHAGRSAGADARAGVFGGGVRLERPGGDLYFGGQLRAVRIPDSEISAQGALYGERPVGRGDRRPAGFQPAGVAALVDRRDRRFRVDRHCQDDFRGAGQESVQSGVGGSCVPVVRLPGADDDFSPSGRTVGRRFSGATPLAAVKAELVSHTSVNYQDVLFGSIPGSLGEVSALLLLVGAVYLLWRKVITWHIPVAVLGTMAVFVFLVGLGQGMHGEALWEFPLFHLLAGGAILGAVYMATDYSTSPMTHTGMLIYGVGIGIITVLIRLWGAYPEGMSFAILIMNSVVPLINKYVKPRRFGLK